LGSESELDRTAQSTLSPTAFSFDDQPTNHISDTAMGDYGIDLLKSVLGSGHKSSSQPFKKKDVPSLAQYIKSDACQTIYLMVILS
jgi:hypothetical protein